MTLKILAGPICEPVTTEELRQYLRIGTHEEDGILLLILKAAVERIEGKIYRAIMHQKLRQNFGRKEIVNAVSKAKQSDGRILLRPDRLGITAIDAVRILSADGDYIIAPTNFATLFNEWLEITRDCLGLEIDYFAGAASPDDVSNEIKIQILEEALKLFNIRENERLNANNIDGVRL